MALAVLSGVGLMAGIGIAFFALGLHDIHQQRRAYRQSSYYHDEQRSRSSGAQQQQPSQAQAAEAREDRRAPALSLMRTPNSCALGCGRVLHAMHLVLKGSRALSQRETSKQALTQHAVHAAGCCSGYWRRWSSSSTSCKGCPPARSAGAQNPLRAHTYAPVHACHPAFRGAASGHEQAAARCFQHCPRVLLR